MLMIGSWFLDSDYVMSQYHRTSFSTDSNIFGLIFSCLKSLIVTLHEALNMLSDIFQ